MYLLVDLSEKDIIHLSLFDADKKNDIHVNGMNRDLLQSIDDYLHSEQVKKEDVSGIMVVVGAGGFTSTRIAAIVANTFAYVLNIPLLAIQKEDVQRTQTLISELLAQPIGQYISAAYSGEPNIGRKGIFYG